MPPTSPLHPEALHDVMIVSPHWRYMTHTFPDGRPLRETCEAALQAFGEVVQTTWKEIMGEGSSTPDPKPLPNDTGICLPFGLYDQTAAEADVSWSMALHGTGYGAQIVRQYIERVGGVEAIKGRMRAKIDAQKAGAIEVNPVTGAPLETLSRALDPAANKIAPPSEKK